jgi:rubrerythrin
MRKITIVLAGLLMTGALAVAQAEEMGKPAVPAKAPVSAPAKKPAAKKKSVKKAAVQKKAMYQCAMCGITSDKPGKCPKCGMEMTKI